MATTHKTINNIWAGLSTNKSNFSEAEIGQGILYKGSVVSNQLNGVCNSVYQMLDLIQRTGGLYNSNKTYFYNNVVSIIRANGTTPPHLEYYRCVSNNESGVRGLSNAPILEGTYDEFADIPIFQGGVLNAALWEAADPSGLTAIYQTKTDFDTSKIIKLFNLQELMSLDKYSHRVRGEFQMTIFYDSGADMPDVVEDMRVTTFIIKLYGLYSKHPDGAISVLPNRLSIPAPEMEFLEVRTNVTDYGEENDFKSLSPFGVRFEYNNDLSSSADTSIYMRVRRGVKRIVIDGESESINVTLNQEVEPLTNYLVIPVRERGIFEDFANLGDVVFRDYELPVEMQYFQGLFKLTASSSSAIVGNDTDSAMWGKDKSATSPLFGVLKKIRGNLVVPSYQGAFLRNLGEHNIPGIGDDVPARLPGSEQTDAIRNITGTFVGGRTLSPTNDASGAFKTSATRDMLVNTGSATQAFYTYDASRIVPTSHDNHPRNIAGYMFYKAF